MSALENVKGLKKADKYYQDYCSRAVGMSDPPAHFVLFCKLQ